MSPQPETTPSVLVDEPAVELAVEPPAVKPVAGEKQEQAVEPAAKGAEPITPRRRASLFSAVDVLLSLGTKSSDDEKSEGDTLAAEDTLEEEDEEQAQAPKRQPSKKKTKKEKTPEGGGEADSESEPDGPEPHANAAARSRAVHRPQFVGQMVKPMMMYANDMPPQPNPFHGGVVSHQAPVVTMANHHVVPQHFQHYVSPDGRPMPAEHFQYMHGHPGHPGMQPGIQYGHPAIQYQASRPLMKPQYSKADSEMQEEAMPPAARGDRGAAATSKPGIDADPKYADLLDMSTTEFNRYLKMCALDPEQILELRKARRRKKNRLYAKRSRGKKLQKLLDMNAKCTLLQAKVSTLTNANNQGMNLPI